MGFHLHYILLQLPINYNVINYKKGFANFEGF